MHQGLTLGAHTGPIQRDPQLGSGLWAVIHDGRHDGLDRPIDVLSLEAELPESPVVPRADLRCRQGVQPPVVVGCYQMERPPVEPADHGPPAPGQRVVDVGHPGEPTPRPNGQSRAPGVLRLHGEDPLDHLLGAGRGAGAEQLCVQPGGQPAGKGLGQIAHRPGVCPFSTSGGSVVISPGQPLGADSADRQWRPARDAQNLGVGRIDPAALPRETVSPQLTHWPPQWRRANREPGPRGRTWVRAGRGRTTPAVPAGTVDTNPVRTNPVDTHRDPGRRSTGGSLTCCPTTCGSAMSTDTSYGARHRAPVRPRGDLCPSVLIPSLASVCAD